MSVVTLIEFEPVYGMVIVIKNNFQQCFLILCMNGSALDSGFTRAARNVENHQSKK